MKYFPPSNAPKLSDLIKTVYIVAHKENTKQLQNALREENLDFEEIRTPYTKEQEGYSAHIRCLINHANAWERISRISGYAMIVEADFVPVKKISALPLPFVPNPSVKAMAWLYSIGPVFYHVDENGAMYGHNAGTVAYVLDATCAKNLLELYYEDMSCTDPGRYRQWEVYFPIKLRRERGIRTYIPYKMYGEHGGLPNREHGRHQYRGWHNADILAGKLYFLPLYAGGSYFRFKLFRLAGWLRGIYKFVRGKYFDTWGTWYHEREGRIERIVLVCRRIL